MDLVYKPDHVLTHHQDLEDNNAVAQTQKYVKQVFNAQSMAVGLLGHLVEPHVEPQHRAEHAQTLHHNMVDHNVLVPILKHATQMSNAHVPKA